jgi:hypothetical protein
MRDRYLARGASALLILLLSELYMAARLEFPLA